MKKGDFAVLLIILSTLFIMLSPLTSQSFSMLSKQHPYLMGFLKFAVLATTGEILAIRLREKKYRMPNHLLARIIIWGIVGIMIVFCFGMYEAGVEGAVDKGLLPAVNIPVYIPFLVSTIMNLTFGIVFMGSHRISDAYLDMLANGEKGGVVAAIEKVNWKYFFTFIVGKTIPFFWVPAHTITFLLPPQYRILVAAMLSIALGLILSFATRKK